MTRQELNREILHLLSELNEAWPDLRFGQLIMAAEVGHMTLISGHIENKISFYEESSETLKRVKKAIKKFKFLPE